jgi:16S rRNA (uracil1498-N3)-methyltransferase
MAPRIYLPHLHPGNVALSPDQAHHIRDVLRLRPGDTVDVFDAAGATAEANLTTVTAKSVTAQVGPVRQAPAGWQSLTLAVALPKGPRADWMIEKLSELGVARLIPLLTERSVAQAAGKSKTERWHRIAVESAKQSRRLGVMAITPPTPLTDLADCWRNAADVAPAAPPATWLLSTEPGAQSAANALRAGPAPNLLLVGPEGGWTDDELILLGQYPIKRVRLLQSILRVETAAIAAAALVLSIAMSAVDEASRSPNQTNSQ